MLGLFVGDGVIICTASGSTASPAFASPPWWDRVACMQS